MRERRSPSPASSSSFEGYVAGHQRSLFRFAVVLCADVVLAEDLVQDVLGRAYERWGQVSRAANVHAYVRRMLVNEFIGWRRRLTRTAPHADVGLYLDAVPDSTAQHADREELMAELAKLPRRQRAALVLRYYEGLSYADIADAMGCGQGAVRSYVSRGLANLRIELDESNDHASLSLKET
jgi:RNA polymerase sigma-70 factor (sigma-E family)